MRPGADDNSTLNAGPGRDVPWNIVPLRKGSRRKVVAQTAHVACQMCGLLMSEVNWQESGVCSDP